MLAPKNRFVSLSIFNFFVIFSILAGIVAAAEPKLQLSATEITTNLLSYNLSTERKLYFDFHLNRIRIDFVKGNIGAGSNGNIWIYNLQTGKQYILYSKTKTYKEKPGLDIDGAVDTFLLENPCRSSQDSD